MSVLTNRTRSGACGNAERVVVAGVAGDRSVVRVDGSDGGQLGRVHRGLRLVAVVVGAADLERAHVVRAQHPVAEAARGARRAAGHVRARPARLGRAINRDHRLRERANLIYY